MRTAVGGVLLSNATFTERLTWKHHLNRQLFFSARAVIDLNLFLQVLVAEDVKFVRRFGVLLISNGTRDRVDHVVCLSFAMRNTRRFVPGVFHLELHHRRLFERVDAR